MARSRSIRATRSLYTLISHGEVVAHTKNGVASLGVGIGFANITATQAVVLANFGILTEEADAARAQEAKERAEDIIKNRSSQDLALAEAELSRSLLEIKLAMRRNLTLSATSALPAASRPAFFFGFVALFHP